MKDKYWKLREDWVEKRIRGGGVEDERIIDAFKQVPRHMFVDTVSAGDAYNNYPIPIGHGQTISQPFLVALMTQYLSLEADEKVLEIGTGSGYQAAILSRLVDKVITIERIKDLSEKAADRFDELGYDNVQVEVGDGKGGYEPDAPYDAIMVTAVADEIPDKLITQLKDSGRLLIPVKKGWKGQRLELITKKGSKVNSRELDWVVFVPLV